jgi:hypothetical protein
MSSRTHPISADNGGDTPSAGIDWPPQLEVRQFGDDGYTVHAVDPPAERDPGRARATSPGLAGPRPPARANQQPPYLVLGLVAIIAVQGVAMWYPHSKDARVTSTQRDAALLRNPGGSARSAAASRPTGDPDVPAPARHAASAQVHDDRAPATVEMRIETEPASAAATVYIDGVRRGRAPLTVGSLERGPHRVHLYASGLDVEQRVTLSGPLTTVIIPVRPATLQAGWVTVDAPLELTVTEMGQTLGTLGVSAQRRIQFTAGTHQLVLASEPFGVRLDAVVKVKPGGTVVLRPDLPEGRLNVNAVPWAEVQVDGRDVGTTPLAAVPVRVGRHEVIFRHPNLGEVRRFVDVTASDRARVSVVFPR